MGKFITFFFHFLFFIQFITFSSVYHFSSIYYFFFNFYYLSSGTIYNFLLNLSLFLYCVLFNLYHFHHITFHDSFLHTNECEMVTDVNISCINNLFSGWLHWLDHIYQIEVECNPDNPYKQTAYCQKNN